ncbi:MAG: aldolase/citrate lyase family protein [Reichenbachiella sp.]|uniref:HpcH/HpaI aldolase family protein n=1 Tax=Reichenbachiella sp. TaxID=2184521 RepID=UPI0032644491
MKNEVKDRLKEGRPIANGWLHIPSGWTAEVMATAKWDALTVDLQHGMIGFDTALQMLQAISTSNLVPMARVGWNRPEQIMKLLDAGAMGIICPMVNSREECESFVQACKYPPSGIRSMGPTRAKLLHGDEYLEKANEQVLTLAMIETTEAVRNLKEILNVDGLDGIFVGTGDLKQSIKAENPNGNIQKLLDSALNMIVEQTQKKQRIPGIWSPSLEVAKVMMNKGYQLISFMSDSMILTQYSRQLVADLKSSFEEKQ